MIKYTKLLFLEIFLNSCFENFVEPRDNQLNIKSTPPYSSIEEEKNKIETTKKKFNDIINNMNLNQKVKNIISGFIKNKSEKLFSDAYNIKNISNPLMKIIPRLNFNKKSEKEINYILDSMLANELKLKNIEGLKGDINWIFKKEIYEKIKRTFNSYLILFGKEEFELGEKIWSKIPEDGIKLIYFLKQNKKLTKKIIDQNNKLQLNDSIINKIRYLNKCYKKEKDEEIRDKLLDIGKQIDKLPNSKIDILNNPAYDNLDKHYKKKLIDLISNKKIENEVIYILSNNYSNKKDYNFIIDRVNDMNDINNQLSFAQFIEKQSILVNDETLEEKLGFDIDFKILDWKVDWYEKKGLLD